MSKHPLRVKLDPRIQVEPLPSRAEGRYTMHYWRFLCRGVECYGALAAVPGRETADREYNAIADEVYDYYFGKVGDLNA